MLKTEISYKWTKDLTIRTKVETRNIPPNDKDHNADDD
jgi:hypothetical protein